MHEQTTNPTTEHHDRWSQRMLGWTFDNLQELRRGWASYGLSVGKAALDTSAGTLKATAAFLEGLAEKLGEKAVAEAPPIDDGVEPPAQAPGA